MQVDLESVLPGQVPPYKSQVCIIGGGIAGLVLATTLAKAGVEVHLLEAGGRTAEPEPRSQAIYAASMAARHHAGATYGRFRTFGGSSTRWGGQLLPYTADIFAPPAGLPSQSWPIGPGDLSRFYPQVEALLGADHLPYTAEIYQDFRRNPPAALASGGDITLRASKWAPFSRRNLAQTLGEQAIACADKATVFFHANVTELLLAPDGTRIEAILARNYQGQTFRFQARHYALAAGTIETSRLLLASRSVVPAGVGNDHDQVGRGFHDHLSYRAAEFSGPARTRMLEWFAPILVDGTTHTAKLEASPALRERLGLLAVMAHVTIDEPEHSGAAVVRGLLQSMQRGDFGSAFSTSLPHLPGASIEILRLAWNARVRKRRAVSRAASVTLRIDSEQRARPENRIRLDYEHLDTLGLPGTIIDWRVSDDEIRSIRTYAAFLQEQLPLLGVDPIRWQPELARPDAPLTNITDTYHPMGGAIMGRDPASSVVDPDLSLHGVSNLSIASCATFPAGGSSNPTFTLMALTLRLAESLGKRLHANRLTSADREPIAANT